MKYKLLRLSLLGMLVMFFGGLAFADQVTMKYSGETTGNMVADGSNEAQTFGLDPGAWEVIGDKGQASNAPGLNKSGDFRLYYNASGSNTITVRSLTQTTINSIAITFTGANYSNVSVTVDGRTVSGKEGVFDINSTSFVLGNANTSNAQVRISEIVITYGEAVEVDNRIATTMTIGDHQTTGIVNNSMDVPEATVHDASGAQVNVGYIDWTSSDDTVAGIADGNIGFLNPGTTTITASFAGDNQYKPCSASFTLTITAAPYTTIAAMLQDITSTKTTVTYQFENLLVTYVNGQNTYVSDGQNGFLFYGKDLGLVEGYTYSGTATGQLYTYNGLPEMALTANGLSVQMQTEGNEIDYATIVPADLQNNINVPVTIENAVFVEASGKSVTFKVGEEALSVYNNWSVDVTALEAGKTYTLTGIGSIYVKGEATTYQLYLVSFEEKVEQSEPQWAWADIRADFTNGSFFAEGESGTYGLKMNVTDGGFTRVAADDLTANAVITGAYHSNEHGIQRFSATVKVEGPVMIQFGTCAWGGNVTVKDADGSDVVKTFTTNTGACYHNNKQANIVTAYYKGGATTLTIAGGSYVPYFAVIAVDPQDIPNDAKVTFVLGDEANEVQGVVPAEMTVEIGSTITIPANRTLYREGFTLVGWTNGGEPLVPGTELTITEDTELYAAWREAVAPENITEPMTVVWDFQQKNGAPVLNYQNKTGIYVAQCTVNGTTYDVKMDFDTNNGGKIANGSWQDWCQMNGGTKLTIPAQKGMTVSLESYSATTTTTIAGSTDYTTEGNVVTYTYEGNAETIDIVIGDGSYFRYVKAVYPVPAEEVPSNWVDIRADFTNGSFFTAEENQSVISAGLRMEKDGTFTRVAADDPTANAIITGKYHSNEHGLANFSATVKVEGPVKVSMGTCAWGGDVTVKDADGATVATFNTNTGACYHNDKVNNIVSAFYKGDATTLTISGGSYTPFFAVEAVDPADIPNDCKISFDIANSGAEGVAPADETIAIGKKYTLPKNFSLYKEGMTLTGWAAQGAMYVPGETITVPDAESLTFFPVFTENEVSLADRTEAVTVKFDFQRKNGAPTVAYQNQTGIWVAQATVGGKTIDVKADFDTNNGGKFANGNWTDWAQLNGGTKWTIPSCKGATVSMEAYSDITTTTIDGQSDYTQGKTISYTIAGSAETVDVVIGDGSYYRYIQVVLPKVEQQQGGGETFTDEVATIEWPFNDTANLAGTANPESAFSTVATNTGDLEITGAATRTADSNADGITFIKFKPSGSTKAVEWVVKPAAGLTFTPTKVSMWIQRFGTDAENGVTVSAKAGEGDAVTLGNYTAPRANHDTAKDKYAKNTNYTNHVVIELTAEQQRALTSGEGLTLSATVGVGGTKEGGFSDIIIEGLVNGTKADVAMYTLVTAVAPAEAGTINVYPVSEQYEEGSEVTLTATENFGYDFVNWTNAAGEEVSQEAKFKYTVNSNETLTANFVAVETYELALTVDGTNDYMVKISPAPEMVEGKMMYEAGTAVQLQADQYEGLVTFTNWNDGETNSSKLISMTADTQITAFYAQADIIAGWDFYTAGSNGRKADFYAQDNDADALTLVNTESGETSGWLDKSTLGGGGYESFTGAAVNWRTGAKNGDVGNWHWQTKVNAEAFTDINVQFQMLYNYNAYQRYNAEYSVDGQQWTQFGTITMTGAKAAASFSQQLPAEANNQSELYIRMIADKTSNVDGAASANDGNTLAMFFITGTPKLVDDGTAPVLVSSVPADGATGASASGKIVLTFDERVKLADTFMPTATLGSQTLTPAVSGKTVTFEYKGLEYSTEYTFTLPGGSIADLTNNFIVDPITLSFTTMVRPSVQKGLYDYVVENVEDLLAAINEAAARNDQNTRYRIFIKNGSYTIPVQSNKLVAKAEGYEVPECITFLNASNVSFIGESRDGVIITNGIDKNATFAGQYGTTSKYDGIGNSDVFQIGNRVSGLYWQDLTVETGMDDATGRDLAIQDRGTKNIYKNVGLRGYQDTWTSNNDNGLYYFEDGYVRGRTDYMCGKGDIFWNRVELRQIAGGYAAVPSKPAKYGWVYKDCVINGEGATVNYATGETRTAAQVDGNYTLGRPWGSGTPIALFIDTKMNVVPSAIGWNEMGSGWPARFAEYNSMTSTGSVIDLSGRKKTFGDGHANNPVLTAEEALENSDLHRMYGDWDPTLATEQAPLPSNVVVNKDTKVLSWADSDYALLYAIVKDGKVVDFTIENTYTVDDISATWAVRAANEMGGLSDASEAAYTTNITEIANGEQAVPETIYNLGGVRVQKAQRGLYIINGKKVVVK
ncbi:MAG: Ig-like domain-containing protein [Prevotella sp.]|nr:Ig-like domain-containing protein [Prevotella sp.]